MYEMGMRRRKKCFETNNSSAQQRRTTEGTRVRMPEVSSMMKEWSFLQSIYMFTVNDEMNFFLPFHTKWSNVSEIWNVSFEGDFLSLVVELSSSLFWRIHFDSSVVCALSRKTRWFFIFSTARFFRRETTTNVDSTQEWWHHKHFQFQRFSSISREPLRSHRRHTQHTA